MSTKKQGRQPKPKPDPDARIKEFAARFWQYTDAKKFDFNPKNWPRTFHLKIGLNPVGQVSINWSTVIDKLLYAIKSNDIPNDKFAELLKSAAPEARKDVATHLLIMAFHFLEYLPEKLNAAMVDMTLEAVEKERIRNLKELGIKYTDRRSETAEWIGEREVKKIKHRLGVGRGGARHKRKFEDEVELPLLVHFIDSARPLWD